MPGAALEPFLKIGVTFAFFQSPGTRPVSRDRCMMVASGFSSWSISFCSSWGPSPSGPAAEPALKGFTFFLTFSAVILAVSTGRSIRSSFGLGILLVSSLVNTLAKNAFSNSDISLSPLTVLPVSSLSGPTPALLFVFIFTYE